MEKTYAIDKFIQFRYKQLLANQLSELKSLAKRSGFNKDVEIMALLNKHKDEIYEIIDADKQVFLTRASVLGYLDRYVQKSLTQYRI